MWGREQKGLEGGGFNDAQSFYSEKQEGGTLRRLRYRMCDEFGCKIIGFKFLWEVREEKPET